MTDTPGRLLSSLSNGDGRPPKVGGCVGVFFQLFDWNRRLSGKHLFSTKSLPAERPKNKKFNDEKLPMAKLLLIADENRGGFPRNSSSECQSEVGSDKSSENGSSKRPGVVARLMGLESLPDTDTQLQQSKELKKQPHQQQQEHHKMHHYQELQMLEDLLQAQSEDLRKAPSNTRRDKLADFTRSSVEAVATRESLSKPFMREEKMPKNTKKNQERMDKFAKLPLSPKRSGLPFASILSPSKSNKVAPPIKSQSTSSNRRTALLLGAAVKILEPSMHPSGKARPLLEKGSDSGVTTAKGIHGNSFHSDLRKSLPKNNKQAQKSNKDASEKQEVKKNSGSVRTPTSLFQSRSSSKNGSNKCSSKQQLEGVKSQSKLDTAAKIEDQASVSEHEDEFQSLECDSQASSSKENRNAVKFQGVPPPVATTATFRRSGSVKEDQPPTPPSRGSLFRSKSVKEEATPTTPQVLQPQQGVEKCGGKEVRLKREKRQRSSLQEGSSDSGTQKSEPMRRKPALDQGRTNPRGNQQEAQQKSRSSVPPKQSRAPVQKQSGKSSLLSYDRLFGTRKQNENSSKGEPTNSEEQAKKNSKQEASMKSKEVQKKSSETSLMKSLLRRKPLSKAETVSSAKKKVAERPRSNKEQQFQAYERQTRSGGSSPARNFKEVGTVHAVQPEECDSCFASTEAKLCEQQAVHDRYGLEVLKERNQQPGGRDNLQRQTSSVRLNDPVVVTSPEKLHGGEKQQVYFEADMLTDRSLEEILKTILSKSLKGRPSLGDSPLGKASREEAPMENVAIKGAEDATLVDMEISPAGTEATSPCDGQLSDLPSKVLFEDDEKQVSTPFSPSKSFDSGMFALPLMDTGDPTKTVVSAEDGGQPSPVSVLDFSAMQSPFPSEAATSGEEIDEDGKHLESVAESAAAASTNVISNDKTMDAILDSFSIKFPDLSEMGSEDAASCAGHEIECYIREVLTASGLVTDDGLEPAGVPCSREIFERLEKQQRIQGLLECASDMQLCSKKFETPTATLTGSCHRLMYDCIGEALNLTLAPFRDENLCSGWSSLRQRPHGEELMNEVAGHILSWREMTLGMVDDLVEVDMSTASGKWNEFSEESRELGLDLERMIFRSVFEDLIVDMVGLRSTTRRLRALQGSSFYYNDNAS